MPPTCVNIRAFPFSLQGGRLVPRATGAFGSPNRMLRAQISRPHAESVLHEGRKQPNIRATAEVIQESQLREFNEAPYPKRSDETQKTNGTAHDP